MTTMSTWLGVQGIELYGGTKDEFDDVKKQLQVRLKPVTPEDWRQGVFKTLRCLYTAPCLTSVPILQAVNGASLRGNKVTIKPTGPGDEKLAGFPDSSNAGWDGFGNLTFIPQDHDNPDRSLSFDLADEVLLHELVHAMRTFRGVTDLKTLPANKNQDYDNIDEFCAVVITNIYRSENRRPRLLKDHHAPSVELPQPYNDPRQFASLWRDPLRVIQRQLGSVFASIATVRCPFNPFAVL
jgi:hypothetical protein